MPERRNDPATDALEILEQRYGMDEKRRAQLAEHRQKGEVALQVYRLRQASKLSQRQLAERIGTRQSVISLLEDADYEGHSLRMLNKIAKALGVRLRVEFEIPPGHSFAAHKEGTGSPRAPSRSRSARSIVGKTRTVKNAGSKKVGSTKQRSATSKAAPKKSATRRR